MGRLTRGAWPIVTAYTQGGNAVPSIGGGGGGLDHVQAVYSMSTVPAPSGTPNFVQFNPMLDDIHKELKLIKLTAPAGTEEIDMNTTDITSEGAFFVEVSPTVQCVFAIYTGGALADSITLQPGRHLLMCHYITSWHVDKVGGSGGSTPIPADMAHKVLAYAEDGTTISIGMELSTISFANSPTPNITTGRNEVQLDDGSAIRHGGTTAADVYVSYFDNGGIETKMYDATAGGWVQDTISVSQLDIQDILKADADSVLFDVNTQYNTILHYDVIDAFKALHGVDLSSKANKINQLATQDTTVKAFMSTQPGYIFQSVPTDKYDVLLTEAIIQQYVDFIVSKTQAGVRNYFQNTFNSISGQFKFKVSGTIHTGIDLYLLEIVVIDTPLGGAPVTTSVFYNQTNVLADLVSTGTIHNIAAKNFLQDHTWLNDVSTFTLQTTNFATQVTTADILALNFWEMFQTKETVQLNMDLIDVHNNTTAGISTLAGDIQALQAQIASSGFSDFAHIIDIPARNRTVKEFTNLTVGTVATFSTNDHFTTTISSTTLEEVATMLWIPSGSSGVKQLHLSSSSGNWKLSFELERFLPVDQINFEVYVYEVSPGGATTTTRIYFDAQMSPTAPADICAGTISNITYAPWKTTNSFVNDATLFNVVGITDTYLQIKGLSIWNDIHSETSRLRLDLADVYYNAEHNTAVLSADITNKADKVIQPALVGLTLYDYFALPKPTTYELPAGISWTTNITQSDIAQLMTICPGLQSRQVATLDWASASGDFYFSISIRTTQITITLNQKQPSGSFIATQLYRGATSGAGSITQLTNEPQIDYLDFINYDQAFMYNQYVTLPIADIRQLSIWNNISFGVAQASVKNLDDVRNDLLGEIVASANTLSQKVPSVFIDATMGTTSIKSDGEMVDIVWLNGSDGSSVEVNVDGSSLAAVNSTNGTALTVTPDDAKLIFPLGDRAQMTGSSILRKSDIAVEQKTPYLEVVLTGSATFNIKAGFGIFAMNATLTTDIPPGTSLGTIHTSTPAAWAPAVETHLNNDVKVLTTGELICDSALTNGTVIRLTACWAYE